MQQFVDPAVSRAKFDKEIADYLALEADYRARGWLLLRAEFPTVLVAFATAKLKPPAIVTGVLLDYSNYDAVPPSVRLVNPFTSEPYKMSEVPTRLRHSVPGSEVNVPGLAAALRVEGIQEFMQAHSPDEIPFLCISGVREYHDHPGHTGDPWELHRADGEGRLVRLLEIIFRYGVEPVTGYNVNLVPQVSLAMPQAPA